MNKFTSLALIIILTSCSQNSQNSSSNEDFSTYPPNSEILEYSDTPGLSKVTVMFANKIEQQGDYFNDKRNGSWTEYHANGVIKSVTTFINGQQHGIQIKIDEKGKLIRKAFFHNGVYDGKLISYKDAKIIEIRNYSYGNLEGKFSKFYKNGKIMEESSYKNNQMHGIAKWYNQDGNVTIQYEYSNGKLINQGK